MLRTFFVNLNACHRRKTTWIKNYLQGRRFLLTEAYKCRTAWEKRLQSPVLQNIKLDDLYYQLDQKFQQDGSASVIDVDLFANAITDDTHIDEVEDILHKLRRSSNTVNMFASTPHAFIRLLLDVEKENQLLEVLNDRMNYGIFPDDYCSILLMDTLIKRKNYTGAAKVGVLHMLQEDWENPLVKHLALYSCHMHLREPGEWSVTEGADQEAPEDSEEVKVRVKFLRNPFFDDHFDLRDPELLIGKTLASLGVAMTDDVERTYHALGLFLYQKWDKCITCLEQFLAKKQQIIKEGVTRMEEILEKHPAEVLSQETKETIVNLINSLKTSGLVVDQDLHKSVLDKIQPVVKSLESEAIKVQESIYQTWEKERLEALQKQIAEFRIQQRLAKVKEEKGKLLKKEEELFFFDNEDKWDLVIEKKQRPTSKKYAGKTKPKKVTDDNYIPPEV